MHKHSFDVRVYYEDTDAGGIVYYANYLKFAERGRTEMLRDAGFEHARMKSETGIAFAVRSCTIDYKAPARLDDCLTVLSEVTEVGGASLQMTQKILKDAEELVTLDIRLACMNEEGRPVRLPDEVREIFEHGRITSRCG